MTSIGDGAELAQLERDAEQNRAALVQTIGALQSRFSPSAIKEDVRTYVREKKDGFIDSLEHRARDNPLQTAAIAAAAAYPLWAVTRRIPIPFLLIGAGFALAGRGGSQRVSVIADVVRQRAGEAAEGIRDTAGRLSRTVSEQAEQGMSAAQRARERAGEIVSEAMATAEASASGLMSAAADRVSAATDRMSAATDRISQEKVKRAAAEAGDWVSDAFGRNPLIVGAVGAAIGAAVAAALPATRQENEYFGDAAGALRGRAKQAAREGLQTAKEMASEVARDVTSYAEEEGLSTASARDAAATVSEKLKTVAGQATGRDFGSSGQQENDLSGERDMSGERMVR